jgi:hypothetical protein
LNLPRVEPFSTRDIAWATALLMLAAIPRLALVLFQAWEVGLSYDALQSVTHAWLSPAAMIQSLRRYDPHPPLFYLQLHYWMKAGASDLWLMLNVTSWSLAAVGSLFAVARAFHGRQAAIVSAVVFALLPYPVWYATDVRMYAMLLTLAIWVYFFEQRFLISGRAWGALAGLLATEAAFIFCHGAGVLLVTAVAAYAMLGLLDPPRRWNRVVVILVIQACLVLLFWRWMSHQMVKEVSHTLGFQLTEVLESLRSLLFGYTFSGSRRLGWASVLWLLGVTLIAATHRESRKTTLCFGLVPIAACAAVSYFLKPIWLSRTFIYVLPFLALAVGVGITQPAAAGLRFGAVRRGLGVAQLGLTLAASLAGLYAQQRDYPCWYRFKQPAQFVREHAAPGDVVCVPHDRLYWCWCWYYIGPGSVNPRKPNDYRVLPDGQRLYGPRYWGKAIRSGKSCWVVYRDSEKKALHQATAGLSREMLTNMRFKNIRVDNMRCTVIKAAPPGHED